MKKPVNKPAENHYDLSQPEVKALWDAAYTKGGKDVTERIIKLLEEQLCSCTLAECQVAQVIALIKGEK